MREPGLSAPVSIEASLQYLAESRRQAILGVLGAKYQNGSNTSTYMKSCSIRRAVVAWHPSLPQDNDQHLRNAENLLHNVLDFMF